VGAIAAGDPVRVTVIRAGAVVDVDLGPRPRVADAIPAPEATP